MSGICRVGPSSVGVTLARTSSFHSVWWRMVMNLGGGRWSELVSNVVALCVLVV